MINTKIILKNSLSNIKLFNKINYIDNLNELKLYLNVISDKCFYFLFNKTLISF